MVAVRDQMALKASLKFEIFAFGTWSQLYRFIALWRDRLSFLYCEHHTLPCLHSHKRVIRKYCHGFNKIKHIICHCTVNSWLINRGGRLCPCTPHTKPTESKICRYLVHQWTSVQNFYFLCWTGCKNWIFSLFAFLPYSPVCGVWYDIQGKKKKQYLTITVQLNNLSFFWYICLMI